jgi:hypothetical protein
MHRAFVSHLREKHHFRFVGTDERLTVKERDRLILVAAMNRAFLPKKRPSETAEREVDGVTWRTVRNGQFEIYIEHGPMKNQVRINGRMAQTKRTVFVIGQGSRLDDPQMWRTSSGARRLNRFLRAAGVDVTKNVALEDLLNEAIGKVVPGSVL